MKSLSVRLSFTAEQDLDAIGRFIIESGASPVVALGFIRRMRARCRTIGDVPYGGRDRSDIEPGLRMVPFERSAVIFYRLKGDHIEIANVFYGGRDYTGLFSGS